MLRVHFAGRPAGFVSPGQAVIPGAILAILVAMLAASGGASGSTRSPSTDSYLVDGDGLPRHHAFFGAPVDLIADLIRKVAGA